MHGTIEDSFMCASDCFFFFQAEDGIRDVAVTGVQTCALPIWWTSGLEAVHWSTLEKELGALAQELSCPGEISWGVSTLVAHGLVMRAVSRQGRDIPPGLLAFWRAAKRYLYDEEPVPPRKIY